MGPDPLHVWGGYGVGALVVQRVVWGFVGPRHARFSDFVRSPIVAWVNLRDLLYGRACRNVGHSPGRRNDHCPPGCLTATVTTGLMGYGEQSKGPLAAVLVTDAKANGKPRALNFPSIKKSAWAAASKLSELSGFVRLAAGGT